MIRINLLAADRPSAQKKKAPGVPGANQAYLIVGGGALAAALLIGFLYWSISSEIADLDQKTAEMQKKKADLETVKQEVDKLEKAKATAERQVKLIEDLKAAQSGPVHMLDEISEALPDFVWLKSLDQIGPLIKLEGESNTLTAVADFITNLESRGAGCGPTAAQRTSCYFPNVELKSTTESTGIITFGLEANFNNPAPPAAATGAPPAPAAPAPGAPARP